MWKEAVAETGIIFYLMLGVGIVGILAKVMNYVTLRKLVNAAGSMSKSTHKLMKLVRAKYEHACMVHDRVENVNAFVEKYIYEYRGFFLKIHTWRQIQIQSIWFAGILAAIGAVGHFMAHGFCEQVYQYGALGAAEMVALFVISQLSDESYKIEAAENYCSVSLIFNIITASYSDAVVNVGYKEFNLILASSVRNCQFTFAATVFRSTSHADNSLRRFEILSILLFKHCLVMTLSSISAISSQLPCFGV